LIKSHLKIDKINLLIGASIGGQQAMEFAITLGNDLDKLILIATNAKHSPWGIAFNESQRLAIEADQTWKENRPDAGISGLIAARSIALLSYRTSNGYNSTQQNQNDDELHSFPASAYQKYQGEKLVKRFNAFSYYLLTKMMDSHNVGRGRISCEAALSSIKAKTVIIGISSDILFPLNEQKYLFSYIPKASFVEIESNLGHDGFLTESEKISNIILSALHSEYEQKEREILKNF
jgi:homoserine O-acetyltransferase